jgi:hypothetical protein
MGTLKKHTWPRASTDGKAGARIKSYVVVLASIKFDIFMDADPGCF